MNQSTGVSPVQYRYRGLSIEIHDSKAASGCAAARVAGIHLKSVIEKTGHARFVVATGASQLDFLAALTADETISWQNTTMFHLDEYLGLLKSHPASFGRYLTERFIDKVHPGTVHLVNGEAADAEKECRRLGALLEEEAIDILFCGIGENCHLAFNDPPADFNALESYSVVALDEACRRQQLGEGWFQSMDEVPTRAISMSIPAIMRTKKIICVVPEQRKAVAVAQAVEGEVTPNHPASVLQRHPDVTLFLDKEAASRLTHKI
jgi:glucosamine-6-phosphate deaminase